ncbi:MAG: DsbA family oxidoreductase [Bacteroidota bacterium]
MKVEIWSDVMCPFCYIGKRKFEAALAQFQHSSEIEIEWRSFQLNPAMVTDPDKNIDAYLAEIKGISLERARQLNAHVTKLAAEVGLTYNFEKAIVANSFDAHRFTHFAKSKGLQNAAEERLFRAYFTEGKNTADHSMLVQLGTEIGLAQKELEEMLNSNAFAQAVNKDIEEARQLGVSGVPFFVLARKYAVSGAQESAVFLSALQKAYNDSREESNETSGAVAEEQS